MRVCYCIKEKIVTFNFSRLNNSNYTITYFMTTVNIEIEGNHFFYSQIKMEFFFLAAPCSMWDLSSPTRDQTPAPCSGSVES